MQQDEIYEPGFVSALFDEMSASYGLTNYVSSFGFCERWRRQCVDAVRIEPGMVVLDLMTGMGECWQFLQERLGPTGRILALDLSSAMCRQATRKGCGLRGCPVSVWRGNALEAALPDGSVDCIVASFGLKTFSRDQIRQLGRQVSRLLRPGGTFSFVEIAVPPSVLRVPYLWYLRYCIPMVGRVFLGNPDNYRLLAVYTEQFFYGDIVTEEFRREGLQVSAERLFFGCARRFSGAKVDERSRAA